MTSGCHSDSGWPMKGSHMSVQGPADVLPYLEGATQLSRPSPLSFVRVSSFVGPVWDWCSKNPDQGHSKCGLLTAASTSPQTRLERHARGPLPIPAESETG